jgi:competence protein ComEA
MKKLMLFLMLFSVSVFATPVNINSASAEEISNLKGIGIKKATAIVAYRKNNGDFANVDELAKVKGIGKKTIVANRDDIKLGKKEKAEKSKK